MSILNRTAPSPTVILRTCHRHKWLRAGNEAGQSLVEFALVVPALLTVVMGILVFGIAINNYLMLTEAVNVGGRLLAISRSSALDPCSIAATAVQGAAPSLTPANMTFTITISNTSGPQGPYGKTCLSTDYTSGAAGYMTQGQPVTLKVTYPCSLKVYGVNYGPSTCLLTAQTTELVQ
jgi:Flp pilus assembly protein TadG